MINDSILRNYGWHHKEMIIEHFLLALRKIFQLKLKFELVITLHNILVVVIE